MKNVPGQRMPYVFIPIPDNWYDREAHEAAHMGLRDFMWGRFRDIEGAVESAAGKALKELRSANEKS